MLVRQLVGIGAVIVFVLLVIFGVNGCMNSRQKNALKDYNRDVTAIISHSDNQVGKPFFQLMAAGARQADQLRVQVSQLRLDADDDVKRAKGLDVPGGMRGAHDNLLLVLGLRAEALRKVADEIPQAQGRGAASEEAIGRIAGQMQQFLASDVVYKVRVAPLIKETLDDEGIDGQTIPDSQFLRSVQWLSASTVGSALGSSSGNDSGGGTPTSGTHGHGLLGVSVGGQALNPSPAVNHIPAGSSVTFTVKFANQGENDEQDVRVNIAVRAAGRKTITQRKTIGQTKSKSEAQVEINLGQAAPTGSAVTVDATITPVPGEQTTDNNKASYTVIFDR